MRERVHIKYTYIYLCSCNSYTCQTGKEFGFPWSVRWRKILLCFKGGVLNYALECRLDGVQNHSRSRPYLCTRAFSDGISWPSPLLHGREDFWVIIHFCCWVGILRVCFQVDIVLQLWLERQQDRQICDRVSVECHPPRKRTEAHPAPLGRWLEFARRAVNYHNLEFYWRCYCNHMRFKLVVIA